MYDVTKAELSAGHQDEAGSYNELLLQADDDDDGLDEPAPVY